MRKSLRASILVVALAVSAHAGEIPTPPAVPPPPSHQPATQGEIQFPPLVEIALTLLALF